MKLKTHRFIATLLVCILAISLFALPAYANITPYQNEIFADSDVYLSSSMVAEFEATTQRPVQKVYISATLQVLRNGRWTNVSTSISPSFSGSNRTGWDAHADYSDYCSEGSTYRISVTFTAEGIPLSNTSNSRTY